MGYFTFELQETVNTLMLPIMTLIGLSFTVSIDPYLKTPLKRVMLIIAALVLSIIISSCISNAQEASWKPTWLMSHTALAVHRYVMRPAVIVLSIYIIWDDHRRRLFWIPVIVNALIYLTAFFRPWTFFYSWDGTFLRGPLGYTAHFISFLLLLSHLIIALQQFKTSAGREKMIPVINVLIVFLGVFMDSRCFDNGTISFTEISTVFCCVFYYTWLHLRFVREHEQALIAEQRIQIMISQIQPHFLYNTLATLQALCLENPRKAAAITERFATYLRQNIDSLNGTNLIPFRKELDHTLVYAQIEMERFPNIHLEYEIEDENFMLPALTIQPLVENAIRHGVRGNRRGQIDIITNLLPDCHEIIIRDNGKGFSMTEEPRPEGSHIGIRNVRERLKKLCDGTMTIESVEGKGTTITIEIPRGKERP